VRGALLLVLSVPLLALMRVLRVLVVLVVLPLPALFLLLMLLLLPEGQDLYLTELFCCKVLVLLKSRTLLAAGIGERGGAGAIQGTAGT
jgi:hypothetical protein